MMTAHEPLDIDTAGGEEAEYRAISGLAVVGLLGGLASLMAVATRSVGLLVIPVAAAAFSVAALVRIARAEGALLGRRAALAGLLLAIASLVAVPSYWSMRAWLVRREGRQFASAWFEYLRHNDPLRAEQLARNPEHRRPPEEDLRAYYGNDPEALAALRGFVAGSTVRALLALGEKAQVRYYATEAQATAAPYDRLTMVFAVTYDEGGRKTFFVRTRLERTHFHTTGRADWTLVEAKGGIKPVALGGELEPEPEAG